VSPEFALAVYGVVLGADGAVSEAETERERDALRAARLEGAPAAARLENATVLHPVCDTIDAVSVGAERRLRCSVCHGDLGEASENPKRAGVVRDRPLAEINPHNARCLTDYVVREYYCPGCATAFAADVAHRDEPMLDEVALV
jgi:hypothetical protein